MAIALTIPIEGKEGETPLEHLEHMLHPWVAFFILPVFAFANAGIPLGDLSIDDFFAPLPLGIAAGLVLGKPIGILGLCWASVKAGWAHLPDGVSWLKLYGVSQLAGIGFTMSLFIGTLAFSDPVAQAAVRVGVLGGSIVAVAIGMVALGWAISKPEAATVPTPAPASAGVAPNPERDD